MSTINNLENEKLEQVYKDKKGNLFFAHKNPLEISAMRGIQGATAERYVSLMISKKEFDLAMEAFDAAQKEMDLTTCFAIVHDLKHRSKFICEANSVLDLANVYYMLQDEDPEDYSEVHADRKRKIWAEDEACRTFFLRMGMALTKQFQSTPPEDLINFMEETKVIAERIYRFISKPAMR